MVEVVDLDGTEITLPSKAIALLTVADASPHITIRRSDGRTYTLTATHEQALTINEVEAASIELERN